MSRLSEEYSGHSEHLPYYGEPVDEMAERKTLKDRADEPWREETDKPPYATLSHRSRNPSAPLAEEEIMQMRWEDKEVDLNLDR